MNATSVKIKFVKMKRFNISRSMKNEHLQAEENEILVAVEMGNLVADDPDHDDNNITYVAAQPYDAAS